MQYLTSFYRHTQAVHRATREHPDLQAQVNLRDYSLAVSRGGRSTNWRPRFVTTINNRMVYVDYPDQQARGFVGWTPYPIRQWPAATDKMVFKQRATEAGIPTPAACTNPKEIRGPFLVKKARSSFGEGIRGPFLSFDAKDPDQQLGEGEFYENFILGHIVKAWYWGSKWVAAEFRAPPLVVGDGRSSLKQLVETLPNPRRREHDWAVLGRLAQYCGISGVDTIPPHGKEVLVDFKYASRYELTSQDNLNVIRKVERTALGPQFLQAGQVFSAAIAPSHPPEQTLFALDAMVDPDGKVWFLEMNSNPMIHPDLYGTMIDSSVGFQDARRSARDAYQQRERGRAS